MKILFLTRVPMTASTFIFPFAMRLRERGHLVEFAFGPGEGVREIEASGFPFTMLPMDKRSSSVGNIRVVNELSTTMRNGRYDVVHSYTPVIGLYGRVAAFKAKIPVVIHSVLGSLLAPGVPFLHRVFYFASELATSRMVDLFITLNDADACAMVKYKLASADRVVSLRYEYGVDLSRFDPDKIDMAQFQELRKKHHLNDGAPVIGFAGRMIGAKGILDLFEAYRQIRARGTRAKLAYLGDTLSSDKDSSSVELLRALVRKSGFEDDVTFFGLQKNVPLYLSLMDVVVLPSHYEGFPRIPVEAGAMRKPSVCTAVAGVEVAVDEGETGFIVPIKDPKRLAAAIEKIITDPLLSRAMGNKARARVAELFDQNKIVDQQVRIYQEFFMKKETGAAYTV